MLNQDGNSQSLIDQNMKVVLAATYENNDISKTFEKFCNGLFDIREMQLVYSS